MDKERFRSLLKKAFAQQLTAQEQEELAKHLADESGQDEVSEMLRDKWSTFEANKDVFSDEAGAKMLGRILHDNVAATSNRKAATIRFFRASRLVAACIAATIVLAMVHMFRKDTVVDELTLSEAIERSGIRPGSDKATVLLSDGSSLVLGDTDDTLLARDHGVRIVNMGNGMVSYQVSEEKRDEVVYNEIQVPKGGHYQILLEDGTKIHMNAESTLRFPVQFSTDVRQVELVGEAYFEVAKDVSRSFFVKTPKQTVHVLGTAFNISAYPESHVKTTLVEGRVDVLCAWESENNVALSPGEAAVSNMDCGSIEVVDCDLDEELAWHNGYFIFTNEPIVEIMSRVARWYDVEIAYEGDMDDVRLGGIFQRSKSIDQLLESFKATGLVNFYIEERRVTVMRK